MPPKRFFSEDFCDHALKAVRKLAIPPVRKLPHADSSLPRDHPASLAKDLTSPLILTQTLDHLLIAFDGSFTPENDTIPAIAGYGTAFHFAGNPVVHDHCAPICIGGLITKITNNVAELMGMVRVLEWISDAGHLQNYYCIRQRICKTNCNRRMASWLQSSFSTKR